MAQSVVCFLHLTRTGGGTLHSVMSRHFPRGTECNIAPPLEGKSSQVSFEAFQKIPQAQKDSIRFLVGHMPFGLHKSFTRPCQYITLLRHPVERAISEYFYVRERPRHPYYATLSHMSLEEYVASGLVGASNFYTHALTNESKFSTIDTLPLAPQALETAKQNLATHFALVGITERLDETLLLLGKLYGWKDLFYVNSGVNPKRPHGDEISPSVYKIFEEHNRLDLELYAHTKELFEEALHVYGPSLAKDLARFRAMNRFLQKTGVTDIRVNGGRVLKRSLRKAVYNVKKRAPSWLKNLYEKKS